MDHRAIKEKLTAHLEATRRENAKGMVWGGLLAAGGYIGAGVLLKLFLMFHLGRDHGVLIDWFWLFYLVLFVVLMAVGCVYEPREVSPARLAYDPFSKKDDHERAEVAGGFFLALPIFLYHYLKALLGFFMNGRECFDLNLAVRLLARATHPAYTLPLREAYASPLPKATVDGTLLTLEDAGVVTISRRSGTLTLTLVGRDLVGQDPVTRHAGMFVP